MKNFLSIEKFKELKALFTLELIIGLLLTMLIYVNNYNITIFDWRPFLISIIIWLISSKVDKEKYWNLATFIGTFPFSYFVFWLMFNLKF